MQGNDKYITVFGNVKEKDYLLDLGVNAIIILQKIAKKYNGGMLYFTQNNSQWRAL
jgi:hypothetical protein